MYDDIGNLPSRKTDDVKDNINRFRDRLKKEKRHVASYNNVDNLKYEIKHAIENAIKDSPRPGWVRADIVEKLGKNSDETLQRIQAIENELKDNYNDRKGILSQINSLAEASLNQSINSFQSNEKINKISNRLETSK